MSASKENHLAGQTSPYLLQHLYNPVDWYPWGDEALSKARRENKPILVSIGYSACHWCHVMERESFEDGQIAALMNENFVCIKVDREERPDIDHLYMNAVQLISRHGGWPLNCFALPDGRPFWGATYFPKDQWKNILVRIAELFKNHLPDLEEQADKVTQGVAKSSELPMSEQDEDFSEELIANMAQSVIESVDMDNGGTRGTPKFPLPSLFEFLLHYNSLYPENKRAIKAVDTTLEKMSMGGIYDQVGGGFARYATDEKWKIPHFEKMLYDNAQLIALYAKAWKANPELTYKKVLTGSIAFIRRELTSTDGTFYAALDADSEGEEGKYYLWTEGELEEILGDDAGLAIDYFNVGGEGFWEKGKSILLKTMSDVAFAQKHNMDSGTLEKKISSLKERLLKARERRKKPGLDDKVIVSWNALMIEALTEAFSALHKEEYKEMAQKATDFILKNAMEKDGKLYHGLHGDKPYIDGFLEDYAAFIRAVMKLYQVTLDEKYILAAYKMVEYVMQSFNQPGTHMFTFSSGEGEQLVAPYYDFQDNVIPSANSIMARNLFYLGHLFERSDWLDRSRKMLNDMRPHLEQYGNWATNWGVLGLHYTKKFMVLAVCGNNAHTICQQLQSHYLPNAFVCGTIHSKSQLPVLQNRFVENEDVIYPCTAKECQQPVKEIHHVLKLFR